MPYQPKIFDAKTVINLGLSSVLLVIGIILAIPTDTFGHNQAWRIFALMASEVHWAEFFIMSSLISFSGSFPKCGFWHRIAALTLLATIHGFIGVLFLIGNPAGIGPIFWIWSVQGYYMVWRAYKWLD